MTESSYWLSTITLNSRYTQKLLHQFKALFQINENALINYGFKGSRNDYDSASESLLKNMTFQLIMNSAMKYAEKEYEPALRGVFYDYGAVPSFCKQSNGDLVPEGVVAFEADNGVRVWILEKNPIAI